MIPNRMMVIMLPHINAWLDPLVPAFICP